MGGDPAHIDHGSIKTNARTPREQRLLELFEGLREVIRCHRPRVVAIEEPFVALNVRTAFAIGEARAAALLAAAAEGLPVASYSPATVKETVVGYGRGDKQQVQEMVRLQLHLKESPRPLDAADALAIALCHALSARFEDRV